MVKDVVKEVCAVVRKHPLVVVPSLIGGCIQGIALWILYLAPQKPVAAVLAPPIRRFFGEKYLHYPFNFYLLPKLWYYAGVCVAATAGLFIMAASVLLVYAAYQRKPLPSGRVLLAGAFRRYWSLFVVYSVFTIFSIGLQRSVRFFYVSGIHIFTVRLVIYWVIVCVFMPLAYAMPMIILGGRGVISGVWASIKLFVKQPGVTAALVGFPALLYVPVIALKHKMPALVGHFFPEIVIGVLVFGIFVSCVIDFMTTAGLTVMVLKNIQLFTGKEP